MKYFLDTNTCIYFLKGKSPRVTSQMKRYGPQDIAVPAMVAAELKLGALKSRNAKQNMEKVSEFLAPLRIIPFDSDAAGSYAAIRADLEKKGSSIGPNDLVIAATTMAQNATLVSNNTRELKRVKGLRLRDWK